MDTNNLLDQAAAAAETSDQTEAPKSFEYEAPAEGYTTARFIGYVEVGKQPQRAFQGVEKPDAPEVRLSFELNGPKHVTEYEHEGEKKTRVNVLRQSLTISTHEKANFAKLLKKMIGGRDGIKHMAQMLGEGFLIRITHSKSKDGKKTYANMKTDGVWDISQPITTDPITNETRVLDVPPAQNDVQLLLWDTPSKEQWDSVFIDGTYEREVDGEKVTKSKNFIQELAMAASNFPGSPLEAMVIGAGGITDSIAKPVEKQETAAPKEADAPVEEKDPLAELGL